MAKALTARGYDITIVTTDVMTHGKTKTNNWLSTDYGKVIYWREALHQLPFRLIWTAMQQIKKHDCIHLTSIFYPPSFILAFFAVWYNKPLIWSPRGELDVLALVYNSWKKRPLLYLIRQFLCKRVVFHSTSNDESRRIKAIMGLKARYCEIPNYMLIPKRMERKRKDRFILCVGRIHPKKALENLIAAIPLLTHQCQFIIAGDHNNEYGKKLQYQVNSLDLKNKIFFIGHIEDDDKEQHYANAYFSIMPSHTENFGNVVIESLAQGTPVIASKGSPWAMLESEKAGFWADNSPENLAKAIDQALSLSETEYIVYRENAYRLVLEKFDIEGNVGKWEKTYKSLINNRLSE